MIRTLLLGSALALAAFPNCAAAQEAPAQIISGTRLDVVATGEVTRVPDLARISAGVVTQAPTATAAIAQNAQQMVSVRAALRRAGIADRDIQTSQISLNPEYRYAENRPPTLTGYRASNEVSVRFRDIANTGKILDALVAEGANQINGPMLELDKPEQALDEARMAALRTAQARAEIYARAVGKRVKRILSISEEVGNFRPVPRPMAEMRAAGAVASTKIDPGEQSVAVSLSVSFELE
jgi:uncharacterized protein YggE